jgi:uncharacterized membrane protein
MDLKLTAGCQISTLILGFVGEIIYISHDKLPKDGKVFSTWSLNQRYCTGL